MSQILKTEADLDAISATDIKRDAAKVIADGGNVEYVRLASEPNVIEVALYGPAWVGAVVQGGDAV